MQKYVFHKAEMRRAELSEENFGDLYFDKLILYIY